MTNLFNSLPIEIAEIIADILMRGKYGILDVINLHIAYPSKITILYLDKLFGDHAEFYIYDDDGIHYDTSYSNRSNQDSYNEINEKLWFSIWENLKLCIDEDADYIEHIVQNPHIYKDTIVHIKNKLILYQTNDENKKWTEHKFYKYFFTEFQKYNKNKYSMIAYTECKSLLNIFKFMDNILCWPGTKCIDTEYLLCFTRGLQYGSYRIWKYNEHINKCELMYIINIIVENELHKFSNKSKTDIYNEIESYIDNNTNIPKLLLYNALLCAKYDNDPLIEKINTHTLST